MVALANRFWKSREATCDSNPHDSLPEKPHIFTGQSLAPTTVLSVADMRKSTDVALKACEAYLELEDADYIGYQSGVKAFFRQPIYEDALSGDDADYWTTMQQSVEFKVSTTERDLCSRVFFVSHVLDALLHSRRASDDEPDESAMRVTGGLIIAASGWLNSVLEFSDESSEGLVSHWGDLARSISNLTNTWMFFASHTPANGSFVQGLSNDIKQSLRTLSLNVQKHNLLSKPNENGCEFRRLVHNTRMWTTTPINETMAENFPAVYPESIVPLLEADSGTSNSPVVIFVHGLGGCLRTWSQLPTRDKAGLYSDVDESRASWKDPPGATIWPTEANSAFGRSMTHMGVSCYAYRYIAPLWRSKRVSGADKYLVPATAKAQTIEQPKRQQQKPQDTETEREAQQLGPRLFKTPAVSIATIGEDLLHSLQTAGLGNRPLIFVCHSMGGLVVKKALLADQSVRERTLGIAFVGVPHLGSYIADPAYWATRASTRMLVSDVVPNLSTRNAELLDLHKQWMSLSSRPHTTCVCETLSSSLGRGLPSMLVVDSTSCSAAAQSNATVNAKGEAIFPTCSTASDAYSFAQTVIQDAQSNTVLMAGTTHRQVSKVGDASASDDSTSASKQALLLPNIIASMVEALLYSIK